MRLVSSNFREILPDRVTTLTASLLASEFERAMLAQYALYGFAISLDHGPAVVILDRKPYFNFDVLIDIAVNCWSGTEESLTKFLGVQGKVLTRAGHTRVRLPLLRALRALRYANRATKEQLNSSRIDILRDNQQLSIDAARGQFARSLLNHLLIGTATAIAYQFAESLLKFFLPRSNNRLVHELLTGTVETASGLQQQAFRKLVDACSLSRHGDITSGDNSHLFEKQFTAYIAAYGHRCAYELELSTPRPYEQPDRFRDEISRLSKVASAPSQHQPGETSPGAHRFAQLLSRNVKKWVVRREMSKSALSKHATIFRKSLLDAGEQLVGQGLVSRERLFDLTIEEISAALLKLKSPKELRLLLEARQPPQHKKTLPEFLDLSVGLMNEPSIDGIASPIRLTGVAASRGRVIGHVRKISEPDEAHDLPDNCILVVRALDSGWISSLMLARGVVTEVGGVLSHAAIVAREHNIPAVFNVPHARALLPDGTIVEVNGDTGEISILSQHPTQLEHISNLS